MDDADRTADKQEVYDRYLLSGKYRRPELPPANGHCFFCGEAVLAGQRFCLEDDCQELFEREQRRKGSV